MSVRRLTGTDKSGGFIKIVYRTRDGLILGATAMAPPAAELITEIAVAIASKMTMAKLATVMHPYPAYSLALQSLAVGVYYEKLQAQTPTLNLLKRIGL